MSQDEVNAAADTDKHDADIPGFSRRETLRMTGLGALALMATPAMARAQNADQSVNATDKKLKRDNEQPTFASQFGAKGDGSDDTAAIQSYHDAMTPGSHLNFTKNATYKIGKIHLDKSVRFGSNGTAENNTQLVARDATDHLLDAQSAPGFWFSDMSFITSVTRMSGAYINLHKVYRGTIRDFRMDGHFIGIRLNNVAQFNIENGTFAFAGPSSASPGGGSIQIGEDEYCGAVNIDKVYFSSQHPVDIYADSYQPTFGIEFRHADNCSLTNCFFGYQGTSIAMVPDKDKFVANIYVSNCTFDYSRRSFQLAPNGGMICHVNVLGGLLAYSHLMGGFFIDSTNGEVSDVRIIGMDIINHVKVTGSADPRNDSPGVGVYIKGPRTRGVYFIGDTFTGSEIGARVDAGMNIVFDGCEFGRIGGAGPASKTGLVIAKGVVGRATRCGFQGCTTPFINNAPTTFLMDEWQDYVPVVTSASGKFGAGGVSATGRFRAVGNAVEVKVKIKITKNGTAAGNLRFTLPIPAVAGSLEGHGRTSVSGRAVQAEDVNANTAALFDATGAYPGGVGTIHAAASYDITIPEPPASD